VGGQKSQARLISLPCTPRQPPALVGHERLGCRRGTARRSVVSRSGCCKPRRALSDVNLRRSKPTSRCVVQQKSRKSTNLIRVWDKVPQRVPLFLEISEFHTCACLHTMKGRVYSKSQQPPVSSAVFSEVHSSD